MKTNKTNFDKIFKAIGNKINANISLLHDEAKGYTFKTLKNEWFIIPFDFCNDAAGLGYINRSLI